MFESDDFAEPDAAALAVIHRRTPAGALTIAGLGAAVVFAIWLAFYLLVFLPRGLLR